MKYTGLEIAVIGMAGRFPGANNIDEYWDSLIAGRQGIRFFQEKELLQAGVSEELIRNPRYVNAAGIMDDKDRFDAEFFGYTPLEAEIMLPQMRMMHEIVWSALEDAGYNPTKSEGQIGLYLGSSSSTAWELITAMSKKNENFAGFSATTLTSRDQIAARISYALNLKGPSMVLDTACSSSLVAVHQACQSLLAGECDVALAGGISFFLNQDQGYLYHEGDIYSPDGQCRAFDSGANGTVRGEGAGMIVLKPLNQALKDHDHIYGVIKGSAINNDGREKIGYTAPSVHGQANVIKNALQAAEVDPQTLTYVEAHGTGTEIGDPIEIEGLKMAFNVERKGYCRIGSVKPNVGHLIHAAGIAGIIKALLALKYKQIPPTLHYVQPNPKINFADSPFIVNDTLTNWTGEFPLRAGVSSFGIGGTNAHVILEEAPLPNKTKSGKKRQQHVILSGRSKSAVLRMMKQLSEHLSKRNVPLGDVAYTLQSGRKDFDYRVHLTVNDTQELIDRLQEIGEKDVKAPLASEPGVFFMFPGQGTQYEKMGYELYKNEKSFRSAFDECNSIYMHHTGGDLKSLLFYSPKNKSNLIHRTEYTQPVIFAFEIALAKLLISWGITPKGMIGHSLGEYTAACIAGILPLEDAMGLVIDRALLMGRLTQGMMMSVDLGRAEVLPYLSDKVCLAAINAPRQCVLSGPIDDITNVKERLLADGIACQQLNTSHAFHSSMMDEIQTAFMDRAARLAYRKPQIPIISNLSGEWASDDSLSNPSYWWNHLRNTVDFSKGIDAILADGKGNIMLEVGPGRILSSLAAQSSKFHASHLTINLVPSVQQKTDSNICLSSGIGKLWQAGINVDWSLMGGSGRIVPLPTYSFEREQYPYESNVEKLLRQQSSSEQLRLVKSKNIQEWFYHPNWKRMPRKLRDASKRDILVFTNEISSWEQSDFVRLNNVKFVQEGESFLLENSRMFELNPMSFSHLEMLFDHLVEQSFIPSQIINLWCLKERLYNHEVLTESVFNRAQHVGIHLLSNISKAIRTSMKNASIEIINFTRDLEDIIGNENIQSQHSTVLSAIKIAPQEYGNIVCRNVDISSDIYHDTVKFIQFIDRESRMQVEMREVAYRNGYRYEKEYTQLLLPDNEEQSIKNQGTYLITGGLGYVGQLLAEHFITAYHGRVAVTSRKPFPAPKLWDTFLNGSTEEIRSLYVGLYKDYYDGRRAPYELKSYIDACFVGTQLPNNNDDSEFYVKLDKLCISYVQQFFLNHGFTLEEIPGLSVEEVMLRLRAIPGFRKMIELFKHMMRSESELLANPVEMYDQVAAAYPNYTGTLELLKHSISSYDDVLTGRTPSVSVLFPEANTSFLQEILGKNNPGETTTTNIIGILGDTIRKFAKAYSNKRKLKILEVGGGSGQLTRAIAPLLNCYQVEYHFTDISDNFIESARHQFRQDFMQFDRFDISKDPSLQGFEPYSYDLVLGYNVVHATPSIQGTVDHLKQLLVPDGTLIMLENVKQQNWMDMIWGLTPGWWLYEDFEDRGISPIAGIEHWKGILKQCGFHSVAIYPHTKEMLQTQTSDVALFVCQQSATITVMWDDAHAEIRSIQDRIQRMSNRRVFNQDNLVITCVDFDQPNEISSWVEHVQMMWGPVNGVIHAAGETQHYKSIAEIHEVDRYLSKFYKPKVKGLMALEQALKDKHVDFCIAMSSVSSILGGLGQIGYAAGNLFMDYHTKRINKRNNSQWISVNWSSWSNWLENIDRSLIGQSYSDLAMTAEEGAMSLERVLSIEGVDQIIHYTGDLSVMTDRWLVSRNQDAALIDDSDLVVDPGLSHDSVEQQLVRIWGKQLGRQDIGGEDHFFQSGGDSLKAVAVVNAINKVFQIELPLTMFFEHPTVSELATIINKMTETAEELDPLVIPPNNKSEETYLASSMQKRMYAIQSLSPESTAYNETLVLEMKGAVDITRLESALQQIIYRHEIFRTSLMINSGVLEQRIIPVVEFNLQHHFIEPNEIDEQIDRLVQPFDLVNPPLLRGALLEIGVHSYYLVIDMHHVTTDLISSQIFLNELMQLYMGKPLGEAVLQYKDFALWQQHHETKRLLLKQKNYWLHELGGDISLLTLPYDGKKPDDQRYRYLGESIDFQLDDQDTAEIKQFLAANHLTLFMLLLSAYSVLLSQYSNQEDIIIGTPVAGRQKEEFWSTMGAFVNTLAIRTNPDPEKLVTDYLNDVKTKCINAFENQDYLFEDLVTELKVDRNLSRNPLFDVMFVFLNAQLENGISTESHKLPDVQVADYHYRSNTSKFDMTITAKEQHGGIRFILEYNKKLFHRATMESYVEQYKRVLLGMIRNSERALSDLEFTGGDEKNLIEKQFNSTEVEFDRTQTVTSVFRTTVDLLPDKTAVTDGVSSMTFRQLDEASDLGASYLRDRGIGRSDCVALMANRSFELIIGILSILKAGVAYVPIDPELPAERIKYILNNCEAKLILCGIERALWYHLDTEHVTVTDMLAQGSGVQSDDRPDPLDIAYVLYTSGSTGRPKGVVITHEAIVNRLNWMQKQFELDRSDVILQKTSIAFDVSIWELFFWFYKGASLHLLGQDEHKDPEAIIQAVKKYNITALHFVPSMLQVWLEYVEAFEATANLRSIKHIFSSGEKLLTEHVRKFNSLLYEESGSKLVNLYGPTEAAIDVSYFECSPLSDDISSIPIGKPIDNMKLYILDTNLKHKAIGAIGEICIAGVGVSKGYINNEILTAEKFIASPFVEGEFLYRTGDYGRWLHDGNMEYLSRMDNQVKVRGYRIELSEIEDALLQMETIANTAVVYEADKGELHAFYEWKQHALAVNKGMSEQLIREFLADQLPVYMIPSNLVEVPQLPRLISGKVDRRALLAFKQNPVRPLVPEDEHTSELEELIREKWQLLLKVDSVGLADNFFYLGGDSIKAIQMINDLRSEGVKISTRDLFQHPTVRQLSKRAVIVTDTNDTTQGLVIGEAVLTPIQRDFLSNAVEKNHFNQSLLLELNVPVDIQILQAVFTSLFEHHDGLRTSFVEQETGEYVQRISNPTAFEVEQYIEQDSIEIESVIARLQSSFNISEGPLVKAGLFRVGEKDLLFITCHHLIIDGVSWRILLEDLETLVTQLINRQPIQLPSKTDSMLDWSASLATYAHTQMMERELPYWESVSSTSFQAIKTEMSGNNNFGSVESVQIQFTEDQTRELLTTANRAYNTVMDDLLITSLLLALHKNFHVRSIGIMIESHGRAELFEEIDVNRTIGWFTSLYPVIFTLKNEADLRMALIDVKDMLRRVPNLGVGYGILRHLTGRDDLSCMPEICYNNLGQFALGENKSLFKPAAKSPDLPIKPSMIRKYLLDVTTLVMEGKLRVQISYSRNQFSMDTMNDVLQDFSYFANQIIAACVQANDSIKTSSDFDYNLLGENELNNLFNS